MRINYTSYDVRRNQETVNPRTSHRDIMVLADVDSDSDDPYMYARIIGIYHVNVIYTGTRVIDCRPRTIQFLWVRWYERDPTAIAGGWKNSALSRLRFPPMADAGSFGFLDPADVLRAAHIVPAFAAGLRYSEDDDGMSPHSRDAGDWNSYYVMRYVCLFSEKNLQKFIDHAGSRIVTF